MSEHTMTETSPRPVLYTTEVPLRWGDMDQLGHVNNTVYFRLFEQARTEWLGSYPQTPEDNNPAYVVIIHTECSFLKELKAPGTVEVRILAGDQGPAASCSIMNCAAPMTPKPWCPRAVPSWSGSARTLAAQPRFPRVFWKTCLATEQLFEGKPINYKGLP